MVYIEQVIIDNLIINAILIYGTLKILKAKPYWYRILIASIIGTSFAVALPFVKKYLIIYKLIALLLTTVFITKYKNFKSYILYTLVFAVLSFLLGGIVYGLFNFVNFEPNDLFAYPTSGVIYLIAISFILIFYIIRQIKHHNERLRLRLENELFADLKIDNQIIKVGCFMDTGNQLYDDLTLKPVSVISKDIGSKYLKGNERTLKVKTVTSTKNLPLITIDEIKIHSKTGDKTLGNIYAVVSDSTYKKYKLILNCAINGGGYEQD